MSLHIDLGARARGFMPVVAIATFALLGIAGATTFGAAPGGVAAAPGTVHAAPGEPMLAEAGEDPGTDARTSASRQQPVRLVVSPTGNEARYRVRERLAGRDLPNDAVGATSDVAGSIALTAEGSIEPQASRITIAAGSLATDSDRRDNYVRRNTLETEQHPEITLVPTSLRGFAGPLPTTGRRSFELVGTLTVRGVSRPTTWEVTADFSDARVTGRATTRFTFEEFELRQPRVPIVLSVSDTIRLEYDFHFDVQRAGAEQ